MVYENIRQEAVLLALSSNDHTLPRRLDEQIFLSQLTCRAVLLNGGFQKAVTAVVKSHLAPGFAQEYEVDKPKLAGHRDDNLPFHGFQRLPSAHRATLNPGWQTRTKPGEGALSSDLTMLSGRLSSRIETRDMLMNERS